jgi:RNA polymerase sigma factor for flagellar operon FliA
MHRTEPNVDGGSEQERITAALPLVQYAVSEVAGRIPAYVDRDDLVAAGMLGLVQAARSWNPDRGVTFERFARRRIRGALLDELRRLDWASRSVRAGARLLQGATDRLSGTSGAAPSSEALAKEVGLSPEAVRRLVADVDRAKVEHLDGLPSPIDPPATGRLEQDPGAGVLQRELLDHLAGAVRCLPERLQKVVVEYYLDQRQMQEIAGDLGVTESRISQMRAEAVALLRSAMQAAFEEVPAAPPTTGRAAARTAAYLAEVSSATSCRARRDSASAPRRRLVAGA